MTDKNILGNTVRNARMNKHITQEGLAEMIGITPIHLKHIEGGQGNPSITVLFNLAKALDFSVDSIIAGNDLTNQDNNAYVLKANINYIIDKCTASELKIILGIIKVIIDNRTDKNNSALYN